MTGRAPHGPDGLDRRDADRPADLPALQKALTEHLAARPERPAGYDPKTEEGWAFFRTWSAWSDKRRRLEHEIWKLLTPKTAPLDCQPRPVPRAYAPAPARFRR